MKKNLSHTNLKLIIFQAFLFASAEVVVITDTLNLSILFDNVQMTGTVYFCILLLVLNGLPQCLMICGYMCKIVSMILLCKYKNEEKNQSL